MASASDLLDYLESGRVKPIDSESPLIVYSKMYLMSFMPAAKSYLLSSSRTAPCPELFLVYNNCHTNRISRRSTFWVLDGALREDADDMLELALRYSSGISGLKRDIAAASKLLRSVYEGIFHQDKKAVAASAISYLFSNYRDPDSPQEPLSSRHFYASIRFATESCRLGLFSFISVVVAECALHTGVRNDPESGIARPLQIILENFLNFKEETGYRPTYCSQCGTNTPLRKCAGPCDGVRKPLYCGRACQKMASFSVAH
ncbi:hypothetical protein NLJ89_g8931 [Agrocybe chaxingu]|uniref:MYND-type domain-containing protein n=1 Tax=Agrocybe chaxingu TaxID=84603 RepID=A0A9W8K1J4_9AGAR|nr:hypothetical protein NLJ89_g8931 [Agrocybe chaxingu]